MTIGTLAELAVVRALNRGLHERIADAQAIADRRAREAYAEGLHRGRAAGLIGFVLGAGAGGLLAAIVVAWFS